MASLASPLTLAATPNEVKVGSVLREAKMQGLNVSSKELSAYRGKPLIINVWASWCGPCREEMGSLQRLASRYKGKSFNVIGISTDDYRDRASAFLRLSNTTFDNFIDSNLLLENMLGANTIPLTLLIDAQGRVLKKFYGFREWDAPETIEMIKKTFRIQF